MLLQHLISCIILGS